MYKVFYYQKPNGEIPVKDFVRSFPDNVIGKINRWISRLQENGPNLRRPIVDKINDKIYELRLSFGHLEPRFLYFYYGKNIIVTHGFLKKTESIPVEEIDRSVRYMNEFLMREGGRVI